MRKIILFFLTILITSCNQKSTDQASYALADMEEEMIPITRQELNSPPPPPLTPIENQTVIKKKIIKDGRLGLLVSELKNTKARVDSLVKIHGAYYANENFNNNDWEESFNLKIRIPCSKFETFISEIEAGDGEIQYKGVDARDVTDQFIDLETRLENKRNYLIELGTL